MNPLEDTIVALRPIKPIVPWDLPNNIRPLNVIAPLGSTDLFQNIDPSGQTANVTNHLVNFGEEYVWHCHILGHEEGMIMRTMAIVVIPRAPLNLVALNVSNNVVLTWTDNSTNEINWTIQRSTVVGPWTTIATFNSTTGQGTGAPVTYTDIGAGSAFYYRVLATNIVGDTTVYAAPAVGYPHETVDSIPSNTASVTSIPKLTVFVRNATTNSVIYTKWNNAPWEAWQDLGGNINSNVTATSSDNNLTIFARNAADNSILSQNWNGSAWGGWKSLGCCVASDISATSNGNNISIFARGFDANIYTLNWNGSNWSGWQSLGCCVPSNIEAKSSGSNISIFARGFDASIYTLNRNASGWSGWKSLGCCVASDIAATSSGSNISIFARGFTNTIYTLNWNGSAWSDWQNLGGLTTGRPEATTG
jgi:hypothetical protein